MDLLKSILLISSAIKEFRGVLISSLTHHFQAFASQVEDINNQTITTASMSYQKDALIKLHVNGIVEDLFGKDK